MDPYRAPAEYSSRHDAEKLTMRRNWQPTEGGDTADVAEYYGMTTSVDDRVGRMMSTLD
jgi:hypothetical protein